MLVVTALAQVELRQLQRNKALAGKPLRLEPSGPRRIGMSVAPARAGDRVIADAEGPILIVDAALLSRTAGLIFDLAGPDAAGRPRRGFRLRSPQRGEMITA